MKNKGFSLVELIIVIAIMAILAAAIAPALIRYIDKSRKSDDLAAAETINTAVNAALANEDAYSEVAKMNYMTSTAGTVFVSASAESAFANTDVPTFISEVNSSIGGTAPKIKYTKDGAAGWGIALSKNGKAMVFIGSSGTEIELQPEISTSYK
mgnify:CR=1 FL=1